MFPKSTWQRKKQIDGWSWTLESAWGRQIHAKPSYALALLQALIAAWRICSRRDSWWEDVRQKFTEAEVVFLFCFFLFARKANPKNRPKGVTKKNNTTPEVLWVESHPFWQMFWWKFKMNLLPKKARNIWKYGWNHYPARNGPSKHFSRQLFRFKFCKKPVVNGEISHNKLPTSTCARLWPMNNRTWSTRRISPNARFPMKSLTPLISSTTIQGVTITVGISWLTRITGRLSQL